MPFIFHLSAGGGYGSAMAGTIAFAREVCFTNWTGEPGARHRLSVK